jgi:hypothetical protein
MMATSSDLYAHHIPLVDALRECYRDSRHLDMIVDCAGMPLAVNVRFGVLCASARGTDGLIYGVHGVQLARGAKAVLDAFADLICAALHGGPRVQRLN